MPQKEIAGLTNPDRALSVPIVPNSGDRASTLVFLLYISKK